MDDSLPRITSALGRLHDAIRQLSKMPRPVGSRWAGAEPAEPMERVYPACARDALRETARLCSVRSCGEGMDVAANPTYVFNAHGVRYRYARPSPVVSGESPPQ